MKLNSFLLTLLAFFVLPVSVYSQNLKQSEILEQSQANLIIVGKISNYGRTYNKYQSESADGTSATFKVLKILKGKFTEARIVVHFPDHLYFPPNSSSILFLTNNSELVIKGSKLGNCRSQVCYYSQLNWLLDNTQKNLISVENLVKKLPNEDEEKAIEIAENFIFTNSYTDVPAIADKDKISLESIECCSDIKEILKSRHTTLEKKAYGILKGRKGDSEGYTVVFRYTNKSISETGRAVTMDLNFKNIRVEHVDIFLKAVQKKLQK